MNVSALIESQIDAVLLKRRREEVPRTYLGASRWGEECTRRLAYEYHHTPTDTPDPVPAHVIRIADIGHDSEERMAEYLRAAGFAIDTVDPKTGKQWEFFDADNRLGGHCDGIIRGMPKAARDVINREYPGPYLWENKVMSDSIWNATRRNGVMMAKPIYWGQLQTYMAYLADGKCKAALFTAVNRDTGKIYAEMVPFVLDVAQILSDRALRVVETEAPEEMPKLTRDPSDWRCGFCPYQQRCHGLKPADIPDAPASYFPAWLKKPLPN